jgi:hypothetical protein
MSNTFTLLYLTFALQFYLPQCLSVRSLCVTVCLPSLSLFVCLIVSLSLPFSFSPSVCLFIVHANKNIYINHS